MKATETKAADWMLEQLESEAPRTRRVLERTPEGRDDWKPHEKSMPLGRLAMLVATMPSWLPMMIDQDELDLSPPGGSRPDQRALRTRAEWLQALDDGVARARKSLAGT